MVMTNLLNGSTISPSFSLNNSKESLATLLRSAAAKITFTKKDGTERTMHCTLQEGVAIPHERKTDRVKEPKPDLLPVWDIEAQAWRTITVPNVLKVVIS